MTVDWDNWKPGVEATLLFVVEGDRILLIEKKRGLGAGKINGPGGKVDHGENPLTAARREFEEELESSPVGVTKCGEVWFHDVDGPVILIHVFRASGLVGELRETEEAVPHWYHLKDIPFDRMWADDRYWFPFMLEGTGFRARTVFAGDELLEWHVDELPGEPST